MTRITKIFSSVLLLTFVAYTAQAQAPANSWTGFYGGVSGTVQGGTSTATGTNTYTTQAPIVEPTGGSTDTAEIAPQAIASDTGGTVVQTEAIAAHRSKTSAGAALRLGYNYQTGNLVIGAEGDINFASFTFGDAGLGNGVAGPNEGYATYTHGSVVGTFRARGGVAFDRLLVFGTGGVALSDLRHTLITNSGFIDSRHQTTGWTGGGGLEYRLSPHVSLAATVLYTDFGNAPLGAGDGTSSFAAGVKTHFVSGALGLNAHF